LAKTHNLPAMLQKNSKRIFAIGSLFALVFGFFLSVIPAGATENGWVTLGSTTLGSAATSISVSSFAGSDELMFVFTGSGFATADDYEIQFNSDTGTNYARKISVDNGAQSTNSSQNAVRTGNSFTDYTGTIIGRVVNIATKPKVGFLNYMTTSGASFANSNDVHFAWSNTSDRITTIKIKSLQAYNIDSGATLTVYGLDTSSVAAFPANASGYLKNDGAGAMTWDSASTVKTFLSLNNVENTALSTWVGSTNLTTLGTVATGTWSASTIAVNKGGTGQTSYTDGQVLIGQTSGNTLSKTTLTAGTNITLNNGSGTIEIIAAGGGGGSSLPSDAEGYLWNDGAGVLSWTGGTGTVVTNYDTMFDALALFLFFFNFVIFGGVMFYKVK